MKVYHIEHNQYSYLNGDRHSFVGIYATKGLALMEINHHKNSILKQCPDMDIEVFNEDLKFGFSYGHPMGSMSFIPGIYICYEREVSEK